MDNDSGRKGYCAQPVRLYCSVRHREVDGTFEQSPIFGRLLPLFQKLYTLANKPVLDGLACELKVTRLLMLLEEFHPIVVALPVLTDPLPGLECQDRAEA
jgi:hypothetical protein